MEINKLFEFDYDAMQRIYNIFNEYENKLADFYFVRNIVKILRDTYNCKKYVSRVIPYKNYTSKNVPLVAGFYSTLDGSIAINNSADSFKFPLTILEMNVEILVRILHEFVHAIQQKLISTSPFSDVGMSINLVCASNGSNSKQRWNDNVYHSYIPDERMANLLSIWMSIKILSFDYFKYKDIIIDLKAAHCISMLDNYEIKDDDSVISPLEQFLRNTNQYDCYSFLIDSAEKYDLCGRVLYGLPITKEEYDFLFDDYSEEYEIHIERIKNMALKDSINSPKRKRIKLKNNNQDKK